MVIISLSEHPQMAGASYTLDEDKKILRYIFDNKAFYVIRGNKLWKDMKEDLPGRPWQSLKNRFYKYILNNLTNPALDLDPVEVKKIEIALFQTHKFPEKKKSRPRKVRAEEDLFKMSSTDAEESETDCDH